MKNKGITIYPPAEIAMNDANCAPVTLSEDGERLVASTIKRWSMPWIRIAIPNDPPPERFQGCNLSTSDSVDSGTIDPIGEIISKCPSASALAWAKRRYYDSHPDMTDADMARFDDAELALDRNPVRFVESGTMSAGAIPYSTQRSILWNVPVPETPDVLVNPGDPTPDMGMPVHPSEYYPGSIYIPECIHR